MVLAVCAQTIKQLSRRCTLVRLKFIALAHVEQRVRLFGSRGHNTTRTVIFERAGNHHLVVGKKCGRERIAFIPLQAFSVELKFNRFRFV